MTTQLTSTRYNKAMLTELEQFPGDMDVWEDNDTRALLVGNDIDNNPDFDANYRGQVSDIRKHIADLLEAAD